MTALTLDQNWLNTKQNKKANNSAFQHFTDFQGTTIGALRTFQFLQKSTKLFNQASKHMGYTPHANSSQLVTNLGVATTAIGVLSVPDTAEKALKSIKAVSATKHPTAIERRVEEAFKDTAGAIATSSFAMTLVSANPLWQSLAQSAGVTGEVADLHLSYNDYKAAKTHEELATGDLKEAFTHTKHYQMLRIAKVVSSLVVTILGLLVLANGAPLVPAIALTALSLAATVIAILRDLSKDWGRYKVIPLNREITIA